MQLIASGSTVPTVSSRPARARTGPAAAPRAAGTPRAPPRSAGRSPREIPATISGNSVFEFPVNRLNRPVFDGSGDPRDNLVQHLLERSGRLVTKDALGFLGGRDAPLHVVLERVVRNDAERLPGALDLPPDRLGQLEHGGRLGGGQVEVLVAGGRVLHRGHDAPGQVTAVGVMAHLLPGAQDVQRVLALVD